MAIPVREVESEVRALFEDNPTMFFTLARDGTIQTVNRFGAASLGYAPAELVGRHVLEVFHPDDRAGVVAALEGHLRAGGDRVSSWTFRKVRKDGSILWVNETVRCIRHEQTELVLVVCMDITSIKTAQAQRDEAIQRAAAYERVAALGALVSGIAHEIRTPLTVVANHAILLDAVLDRHARAGGALDVAAVKLSVSEIQAALDRINRLLGAMRGFHQPLQKDRRPASLHGPVGEAIHLFHATHPSGSRIAARLDPTPSVPIDGLHVQQIVLNLLANAVDAVREKPSAHRVRVRTEPTDDGGGRLVVEDDGDGIPPDVRSRMFEPLFTTKPSGSGLGLAIVERLAREHDARIDCETGPWGTRMTVTFPVR